MIEGLRSHGAAWLMTLVAAALVLPLLGCATADDGLGRIHQQNLALELAQPSDPQRPSEGGSAVRGTWALRRYETGNVRPPTTPPTPPEGSPLNPDAPLPK